MLASPVVPIAQNRSSKAATLPSFDAACREAECRFLLELVERCNWNLSAAARAAGVRNRNTLISRLKKHGIERPRPLE